MARLRLPLMVLTGLGALVLGAGGARAQTAPAAAPEEAVEVAPEPPVAVEVRLGFAAKSATFGFLPITVDLTSRDEPRRVAVSLRTEDKQGVLLDLGQVELEPGVSRRLSGIAPAKLITEGGSLALVVEEDGHAIAEVPVHPDGTGDRLLLVLDHHAAPPSDFSRLVARPRVKGRTEVRWLTATISRLDDVPRTALAYSGVTAVLLGDLELERWSEAQAQALSAWLARGGALYVSVGSRGSLLRKSLLGRRLGRALEPIPFDRAPVPGSDVSLRKVLRELGPLDELATLRPPYLAELIPGEGDVVPLRDDAGRPLVLQRRHGLGSVTLIGADLWAPPFLHVPHTTALLEGLLDPHAQAQGRSPYLFGELSSVPPPVQVGPAFAVLILYALLAGPGVFFLLRGRKRGLLVWLAIPAVTLAFTAVVPFYRLALRAGESSMFGIRLIEARAGDPLGVETLDLILFSGSLGEKQLSLSGADATAYVVHPPQRLRRRRHGGRMPELGPVLGGTPVGGRLSVTIPVAPLGARYVSFQRTGQAPTVTGGVELSVLDGSPGERVVISMRYEGGLPLRDALVVFPGRAGPRYVTLAETIRAGQQVRRELDQPLSAAGFTTSDPDLGRNVMKRLIDSLYAERAQAGRQAFLIAQMDAPDPLHAKPNVRTRAFPAVIVVELPVRYGDGVPFGLARRTEDTTTIASPDTSSVTRALETRLRLPEGAAGRELLRVQVEVRLARPGALPELELEGSFHDAAGLTAWRKLPFELLETDEQARRVVLELPEPAGWVSPAGELRFRQVFKRARNGRDDTHAARVDVAVGWEPEGIGIDAKPPGSEWTSPEPAGDF